MAYQHWIVAALLALAACAPPYKALRPEDVSSQSSEQVERGSDSFKASDGLELYEQWWRDPNGSQGALIIMHGLKDHSSRYDHFARKMVEAGVDVYAFDLRGHGRSAGRRVAVDSFEDYADDLQLYIELVRKRVGDKPIFLFGHSMGGAVATLTAASREVEVQGLILSGPALALDLFPLTVALSLWAGDLLPNVGALKLNNEDFTRNKETLKAMNKDKLVYQDPGPAHTAAELGRGISSIWRKKAGLTMPLLFLHGTKDKLTAPYGSAELHKVAPSTDKRLIIYKGYYHDLLHEPDAQRVENDIASWVRERLK